MGRRNFGDSSGKKMKNAPLFALIDCNNFFVSCEQLFRPDLRGKPVVVMSSGDGCVVARSNEAKEAGIPMGAPVFKHKQTFKDYGVVGFSANFELYGDISRRITEILTSITPRLEVYSIDESFLDISQLDIADYEEWGKVVRTNILKWTGISVRVGIAPTKTLAKLASERTKKLPQSEGVLYLDQEAVDYEKHLRAIQLEDVWGIGWRMSPKLRAAGFSNAWDVAQVDPTQGRKLFGSVSGERLVRELRGESCLQLDTIGEPQKMISATRTFGQDTNQPHVIEASLASFATRAANRLRRQNSSTSRVSIFMTTNRHKPNYRKFYKEIKLAEPTVDTGQLVATAVTLFHELYDPDTEIHRAGVTLTGIKSVEHLQVDLFGQISEKRFSRNIARMQAVDRINKKHGTAFIRSAAEDLSKSWEPKHNVRSPRYTTNWDELPTVTIQ